MVNPLVTVICLCYNHERFVQEAIESVLNQTYPNIEVIIVDDASNDNSRKVISEKLRSHPELNVVFLDTNVGICRAFNAGWRIASGEFVVDFSTDDVLLPERIEKQVRYFQSTGKSNGVVFTDAVYIDEQGREVRRHFDYLRKQKLLTTIPTGDIYADVIARFFVPAPTMLVRREVLRALGGYDETLAYEDFDFWVRSAREFSYGFLNEALTKIRVSSTSLSHKLYLPGDKQAYSTYRVCRKIAQLNETEREKAALQQRLRYELRHCVLTGNHAEGELFYRLMVETGKPDFLSTMLMYIRKLRLPLSSVRRLYHRIRYR